MSTNPPHQKKKTRIRRLVTICPSLLQQEAGCQTNCRIFAPATAVLSRVPLFFVFSISRDCHVLQHAAICTCITRSSPLCQRRAQKAQAKHSKHTLWPALTPSFLPSFSLDSSFAFIKFPRSVRAHRHTTSPKNATKTKHHLRRKKKCARTRDFVDPCACLVSRTNCRDVVLEADIFRYTKKIHTIHRVKTSSVRVSHCFSPPQLFPKSFSFGCCPSAHPTVHLPV